MDKKIGIVPALLRSLIFLAVYMVLNIAAAFLSPGLFRLIQLYNGAVVVPVYGLIVAAVFFYLGYRLLFENWKRDWTGDLIAVLSVPLVGIIIWTCYFFGSHGAGGSFDFSAWMGYMVYSLWSAVFFEYLKSFMEAGSKAFAFIGILALILPSGAAFLGMRAKVWVKAWNDARGQAARKAKRSRKK